MAFAREKPAAGSEVGGGGGTEEGAEVEVELGRRFGGVRGLNLGRWLRRRGRRAARARRYEVAILRRGAGSLPALSGSEKNWWRGFFAN